jgi:hypothetical protein
MTILLNPSGARYMAVTEGQQILFCCLRSLPQLVVSSPTSLVLDHVHCRCPRDTRPYFSPTAPCLYDLANRLPTYYASRLYILPAPSSIWCLCLSLFLSICLLFQESRHIMTMNHETHTFRHARGTFAAFSVSRNKWYYGELLHNIGWAAEDDCGTFLLDDGHVETYKIKVVDDATLRLQKGDYLLSEYKRGLEAGKYKIRMARIKIARDAGEHDTGEVPLSLLQNAAYRAYRKKNPLVPPKPTAPPRPSPLFRVGTLVAAESGEWSDFLPELIAETHSGWCLGKLHAFKSSQVDRPYVIRWATKPFTDTRVSQSTLRKLVRDHNLRGDFVHSQRNQCYSCAAILCMPVDALNLRVLTSSSSQNQPQDGRRLNILIGPMRSNSRNGTRKKTHSWCLTCVASRFHFRISTKILQMDR